MNKDSAYSERTVEPFPAQHPALLEEVDLRQLFRKLWRRKSLIFGTVMFMTVLAVIILYQITPLYTGETYVLIEPRESNVVDLEAVLSGLGSDTETIQSEIEVIRSRQLISKLVDKLRLERNPEFNATLRPKGVLDEYVVPYLDPRQYIPEEWLSAVLGDMEEEIISEQDLRARERAEIVDAVQGELDISIKGRSRVIVISFRSEAPKIAALATNTLADLYIDDQLEAKFEATQRATSWLNERVSGLREKVQASERAVEAYRKKSGLLAGQSGTLTSQQVSELNTQLILAQTARAEAEARLKQVMDLIASTGGGETAAEVLDSLLITRLREQEAEVERRAAELTEEYGDRHPKMINVRAEAQDIQKKIRMEVKKILKGLENEVGVARAGENSLRKSMEKLKGRLAKSNRAEVQLRSLEREANATRVLLETFLTRFKETRTQEDIDIQQADARIISFAEPPVEPSFPKKKLIVALAFVGSTFLGILLAFVVEQLDKGFRSGEQIEKATGVSVLGLVPLLSGVSKLVTSPEIYILNRPTSAFGESIRSLHTSLHVSNADNPPKKILITSAVPKEGKTAITLSLGRFLAKAGHKVIMVDADFRRPGLAKKIGLKTEPGLVDLLSGDTSLEDVLQKDRASGAYVMAAGKPSQSPPDLLASNRLKLIFDGLAKEFDCVLIDSPPVLAVSDSRILSQVADATVFVVRWADTNREIVAQGLKQILSSGGNLAGAVLSQVNAKKHSKYGYSDSGYYYGRIKKYYVS